MTSEWALKTLAKTDSTNFRTKSGQRRSGKNLIVEKEEIMDKTTENTVMYNSQFRCYVDDFALPLRLGNHKRRKPPTDNSHSLSSHTKTNTIQSLKIPDKRHGI